jgi:hypothetical protein
MKVYVIALTVLGIITLLVFGQVSLVSIKATNEGSYEFGYQSGTWKDNSYPEFENGVTCGLVQSYKLSNGTVMPGVTNTTACTHGWYQGYKQWCLNHAVNCVQNIMMGDFPDMIVKAHQEYLRGYNTANGSGNSARMRRSAKDLTKIMMITVIGIVQMLT